MSRKQIYLRFDRTDRRFMAVASATAFLMVFFTSGKLAGIQPVRATNIQPLLSPAAQYGKLPLTFIANAGQTNADALFQVRNNGRSLFFTATGITLSLPVLPTATLSHSVD